MPSPSEAVHLNTYDLAVFAAYMVITLGVGFWAAHGKRSKPKEYFLGGKTMPWFVVGASMFATNVSSEHFIANVGAAYNHGIVPAIGGWQAWITYSLLIWIFLPYYVRSGIYTMPQFLEKRYNATCRYIFAVALVVGYILAIIAASLYAGGVTLHSLFGLDELWGIVIFALVTGAYTTYGGLASAAWTDFLQMLVLLLAGILVPIIGLVKIGGVGTLFRDHPEKMQIFLPMNHPVFPFTGVLTGFLTVGIWYSCTSQHIVQRVLSAKDEWHARTGVVCAGFLHMIGPFFFVVPGLIAFHLYPHLERPDSAYLLLVKQFIPTGLKGLILAGIAAALMSTLSAVLNSASTLVTIDLYRTFFERRITAQSSVACDPDAGGETSHTNDRREVIVGQISSVIILAFSMLTALEFLHLSRTHPNIDSLFVLIQNTFFYIAPPFAVIFTLGLLWRRANAQAAVTTIFAGFAFTALLDQVIFPNVPVLQQFNDKYYHRALLAWIFCMLTMVITSLLTQPPPPEKTEGIIWGPRYARLPEDLRKRYRGIKDFRIWWALFVIIMGGLYCAFLVFRLKHPINMINGWPPSPAK